MPRRTTGCGTDEWIVREPAGGTAVTLAYVADRAQTPAAGRRATDGTT